MLFCFSDLKTITENLNSFTSQLFKIKLCLSKIYIFFSFFIVRKNKENQIRLMHRKKLIGDP